MATRVEIKGIKKFKTKEFVRVVNLSKRQIRELAQQTAFIIKEKITESLQRPGSSGNLANSFFAEQISDNSWGVGNINFLNAQAPYWRWINFGVAGTGRKVPPPSKGSFNPAPREPDAGAFRTGRFTNDGTFLINPQKAIEPHNYIQRTLAEVDSIISATLIKIRR